MIIFVYARQVLLLFYNTFQSFMQALCYECWSEKNSFQVCW